MKDRIVLRLATKEWIACTSTKRVTVDSRLEKGGKRRQVEKKVKVNVKVKVKVKVRRG